MLEAEATTAPAAGPSVVRFTTWLAAAVATGAWAARYGLAVEALVAAGFFATLAVLSAIDIETRRIPNRIVLPATAAAFGAVILLHPEELPASVVAAVAAFLVFFVPGIISGGSIGMGDAKLALLIGAFLGADILAALLVGSLAGGVVALAVVATRGREGFKVPIPYGPFLALGATVALVAGGGTLYS